MTDNKSKMAGKKIGIIGCGNMGEAILSGLLKAGKNTTLLMASELDAKRRDYIQGKYRIIVEIDNNIVVKHSDVIILAVKPKDFETLLKQEICCGISKNKLLISIAAGVTTGSVENIVGKDIPVIRAMPNMPAIIGEGISSLSRGASAGPEHIELAKELFLVVGDVVEVEERFVDAVTALSGSGPAYFCYFLEALAEGAGALGLSDEVSKKLIFKTALGTAKLLDGLNVDPADLRVKVTSKGGTTEAAIRILESKKFKAVIKDALKAAEKRSKELSGKKPLVT